MPPGARAHKLPDSSTSDAAMTPVSGGTPGKTTRTGNLPATPQGGRSAPPPVRGLKTSGGLVTDWSAAVNVIANLWTGHGGIGYWQDKAVEDWYGKAQEKDPPPAWVGVLKSVITIGVGAVTGGIGGVITAKLLDGVSKTATHFIVNTAVEAGKGIVGSATGAMLDAATASHGDDGLFTYKHAQQQTMAQVVRTESQTTAANMSRLAQLGEDDKWRGMQDLYDAFDASTLSAYTTQYGETLEGWFSAMAQQTHGSNQGRTKASALADDWGTSSVGSLGLHLKSSSDPTNRLKVSYCEIESSAGNNQKIRNYFLNSHKKVKDYRMPKVVIGQHMIAPGALLGANFSLAWDEQNNWASQTYGGGAVSLDGGDYNAGRTWLAMYGKNSKRITNDEIAAYLPEGIRQIELGVMGETLKSLGVEDIAT